MEVETYIETCLCKDIHFIIFDFLIDILSQKISAEGNKFHLKDSIYTYQTFKNSYFNIAAGWVFSCKYIYNLYKEYKEGKEISAGQEANMKYSFHITKIPSANVLIPDFTRRIGDVVAARTVDINHYIFVSFDGKIVFSAAPTTEYKIFNSLKRNILKIKCKKHTDIFDEFKIIIGFSELIMRRERRLYAAGPSSKNDIINYHYSLEYESNKIEFDIVVVNAAVITETNTVCKKLVYLKAKDFPKLLVLNSGELVHRLGLNINSLFIKKIDRMLKILFKNPVFNEFMKSKKYKLFMDEEMEYLYNIHIFVNL